MSFHPVSLQVGRWGWLCIGWVGVVRRWLWGAVGADRLFCFVSPLSFCFTFFFLTFLLLTIYFADCRAAAWSHASQIFGVLAVRYFYWEIRKRQNMGMHVCVHVCVGGMLMGVQRQQRRPLHHISTLFLGALLCKCKRKTSRFKVLFSSRGSRRWKRSKWQGVLIVLSALQLAL